MTKLLRAKYIPKYQSYAEEGEELIVAPPDFVIPKKLKLDEDEWFFIGLESQRPSKYAWVYNHNGVSSEDIIERVKQCFNSYLSEEWIGMLRKVYTYIQGLEEERAIFTLYSEVGFPGGKKKAFRVYKIIE